MMKAQFMLYEEIKHDLFDFSKERPDAIMHGCNSLGVMGSGVAKLVKEKYPKAFKDYKEYIDYYSNRKHLKSSLGSVNFSLQYDGLLICNAITQLEYGRDGKRFVSYDALDNIFCNLPYHFKIYNVKTLWIPKIGSMLGGGEWSIISEIIKHRLKDSDINLKVCSL